MKKASGIFVLLFALFSVANAQTGKSKIILKDKTVIPNVKIWNIYANKVEYEEKESLHDILNERIARIETDSSILSFDESGQLFSKPYDYIIKQNDDTVQCIISQLGGNYIYYYPKGRENRSYIPESSVKKYHLYKPEPAQKPEQGSPPYSSQVTVVDTLKQNQITITEETPVTTAMDTSEVKTEASVAAPDSVIKKPESMPEAASETKPEPKDFAPGNDLCYDSYIKGERDASRKGESAWGTGSFCMTGCLGGFGLPAAVLSLVALNNKNRPKNIPAGVDERCYLLGFQNQQTKRRVHNTAIGGLVASVLVIGAYFFALSVNNGM